MVLSSNDNDISNDGDSCSGQLLHDIEEISRALYLPKAPSKAFPLSSEGQSTSNSEVVIQNPLHKDKKLSIWRWNPLKALTHTRDHRFNCCFFLHVHSIEGLPSNFNDLIICVNWKRKNEVLRSHAVRVFQGIAEFDETLMHQSIVCGNRNGPQNSVKYDPKLFLLYVSVLGAPALDVGKHWVDLARLLPLTLEELEEEKRTSGQWTTSFKLKGKAKGATLNVSFGFSVYGDDPFDRSHHFVNISDITERSRFTAIDHFSDHGQMSKNNGLHRLGSIRRKSTDVYCHSSSQSLDIKLLGDVFSGRNPELAQSITLLCQKLDEGKPENPKAFEFFHEHPDLLDLKSAPSVPFSYDDTGNELENAEFIVIDQGVESSVKDELKVWDSYTSFSSSVIETINVAEIFQEDLTDGDENIGFNLKPEPPGSNGCENERSSTNNENGHGEKLVDEDSPVVSNNLMFSKSTELSYSPNENQSIEQENYLKPKPSYSSGKMVRSRSLDDVMDSVASEFLNMLGTEQFPGDMSSESESESPRERLLREFEKECSEFSYPILGVDAVAAQMEVSSISLAGNASVACADDFDLSLVVQETEKEQSGVIQSLRSRRNTKMLEDLETKSLMQQWGLTEKAFQSSPHITSGGFGSPVYLPPEEPCASPPLGEGLGSVIPAKSGGFIQSMNSLLFKSAKNGSKLVLQVSKPVVLPAVMGSTVMEILQCWAIVGAQKMCVQLCELMPLEDITGKTMLQVMTEASAEALDRSRDNSLGMHKKHEESLLQYSENLCSSSFSEGKSSNYVSLEDLVPLAVANTEALCIEGLRIQSGLSDEAAPSSTMPEFPRDFASLGENIKLTRVPSSLRATAFQLSDVKKDAYLDALIKQSVPLDQWIEFDRGDIGCKDETAEWMKILAAYDAKFSDMEDAQLLRNRKSFQLSGSMCGLLGDKFTLAFRLQLRDPFRDYEMVGASMLSLAQVERIFVRLEPEKFSLKSETYYNTKEDDLNEELIYCGTRQEVKQESLNERVVPQFKISEVHVAGMNFEPNDNQPFNGRRQLQSGTRWLLSNGMNRMGKRQFTSSNAIIRTSSQMLRKQSRNILWSLSSQVQCATAKGKELAAFNIHVRNPDIIFSNEL